MLHWFNCLKILFLSQRTRFRTYLLNPLFVTSIMFMSKVKVYRCYLEYASRKGRGIIANSKMLIIMLKKFSANNETKSMWFSLNITSFAQKVCIFHWECNYQKNGNKTLCNVFAIYFLNF